MRKLRLTTGRNDVIGFYEEDYKLQPQLKEEPAYFDYLRLLYIDQRSDSESALVKYAQEMMDASRTESRMKLAMAVYEELGRVDDQKMTRDRILQAWPNGQLASQIFLEKFLSSEDLRQDEILLQLDTFNRRFEQTFSHDAFLMRLLQISLLSQDEMSMDKYEEEMVDKESVTEFYFEQADNILASPSASEGEISFAKSLVLRGLDIISMDTTTASQKETYSSFLRTYAKVFLREDQVDSALYYLNAIRRIHYLDVSTLEIYATCLELTKGKSVAKQFIEHQLLDGTLSLSLLDQLENIYKEQSGQKDSFDIFRNKYLEVVKLQNRRKVLTFLGLDKAPDFSLRNLAGEVVTLNSMLGKIVVLDFWATWCGPCKAAFPQMQTLANEFSLNPDVIFLFIDVLEQGKELKTMQHNAKVLMKQSAYDFNVLFDVKDELIGAYKITAIPTKFVINKAGEIAFAERGGSVENLSFAIEAIIKSSE